jgi:hypothetical protein
MRERKLATKASTGPEAGPEILGPKTGPGPDIPLLPANEQIHQYVGI